MYKFDKQDVKEVLRQQHKTTKNLKFSETIPNNLKSVRNSKEADYACSKQASVLRLTPSSMSVRLSTHFGDCNQQSPLNLSNIIKGIPDSKACLVSKPLKTAVYNYSIGKYQDMTKEIKTSLEE